ncbi:MAG: DUF6178 family protein [Acidobacteriota bacterium]
MSKRKSHRPRIHNAIDAPKPVRAAGLLRAGDSEPGDAHSFRSPLARLLDAPQLARVVPHLAPETLHQLIRHVGLHASGELVASATPAQLTSVFDFDLWRSAQPGLVEQFDADRFGEWLELLVETGEPVAARIVAALDEHLVTVGLSRYIRVFDPSAITSPASIDDDLPDTEMAMFGGLECEVGGYLVRAIRADAWDAIVALLVALDDDYQDCFHRVMRGCRQLSNSVPEVDGLDHLLMRPEQLLHDVALDRERRRSQQGYSTRDDARAFLRLAREGRRRRPDGTPVLNPIAATYLRTAEQTAASADHDASLVPLSAAEPGSTGSVVETRDAIIGLLAESGAVPQRPRALLEGAGSQPSRLACIRPLMEYVRDTDDTAHLMRNRELAFLANTLIAGCSIQSRSFTLQEASDAVVGICNLGLEHWPARWPENDSPGAESTGEPNSLLPRTFLVDHDLVTAFEVGWQVLHQDVCLFVAQRLIVALTALRRADAEVDRELRVLRIELRRYREAGTPWCARDALDVIAILDMPAWVSLLGLMGECPVVPVALTAVLEGRTGSVSATAFEFISTTSQIATVREFMAQLPNVLRR